MVRNGRTTAVPHEQFGPGLAGLALGLAGPGQAALLGQLARCATCTTNLEDLVAVATALSVLTPEADPPSGFEGLVLEAARARALC
jgi:hypothetical protein